MDQSKLEQVRRMREAAAAAQPGRDAAAAMISSAEATSQSRTEALWPFIEQQVDVANQQLANQGVQLAVIRGTSNRPQIIMTMGAYASQGNPTLEVWSTADGKLGYLMFNDRGRVGPVEGELYTWLSVIIGDLVLMGLDVSDPAGA